MTAPQMKPSTDDPGMMQVMKHCHGCAKRVRLRVCQSTLASLHRAISPGAILFDQEFLSYQCRCGHPMMLTLRELGFA